MPEEIRKQFSGASALGLALVAVSMTFGWSWFKISALEERLALQQDIIVAQQKYAFTVGNSTLKLQDRIIETHETIIAVQKALFSAQTILDSMMDDVRLLKKRDRHKDGRSEGTKDNSL